MRGEPPFPEKDGNTGPETWKALCTALDSQIAGTMQLQNCDPASPKLIKCPYVEAVRGLQMILKGNPTLEAFDPGPEDGYFGPLTTAAVKKFQSTHPPLVANGVVDPKTWTAICIADVPPGQAAIDVGPATIEPETSVDVGPATIEPETSVDVGPATIEPETSVDVGPATIEPSPSGSEQSGAPP
jgi:hypothetical protein